MVGKFKSLLLFASLTACGVHEHTKPGLANVSGVWKETECDGKFEVIKLYQDGTFDIRTNKEMATKSLDGAYEVTEGSTIKFYYSTGEVYENRFDFNGKTLSLYRTKITLFTKTPDVAIKENNGNNDNHNINVTVKCDCCNEPGKDPGQDPRQDDPRQDDPRQQRPRPLPFPFPC